jgi:hypothetical protein
VTAVTLAGALLRFDAVSSKYGWLGQPAWALRLEAALLPAVRSARPAQVPWERVESGYAGGDPVNYLKYAREMRDFYQAHVREPVFLALTRGMLRVTGNRDIAVSYASALSSTLTIPATYLLGAAVCSPAAGLIAAAALAIELEASTWGADGWRDDTFSLFVVLCAWCFVRLVRRPTPGFAVVTGVVIAAACLTRITSLSFVVPALVWIAIHRSGWTLAPRPGGARAAAIAGVVAALLVAPYLINCWRATGDPLYAINYHTRYYRAAEGLAPDESEDALGFVTRKLRERPVATADTAAVGLLVFPFTNKWSGLAPWSEALAAAMRWLAVGGLMLAVWYPMGRFLWLILLTSLVPYAITWSLGGGGEWRFTQHAYPLYLVAASTFLVAAARMSRALTRRELRWREAFSRRRIARAAVCVGALAAGWALYYSAPYLVAREALAHGEAVSIGGAPPRDAPFFWSGWSGPNGSGNVIVRRALSDRVSIRIPLPRQSDHLLTLRMDGPTVADRAYEPRVTVFVNNRTLGQVRFTHDPMRVGTYRMTIPRDLAGRTFGRLDLVASHTVSAAEAGPRFADLPADSRVAFYLWYVRVEPMGVTIP